MSADPRKEVEIELDLLGRLLETARPLLESIAAGTLPSPTEVYALAGIVQSFYNGVENTFKRLATLVDRHVPSGPDFHRELLARMASANPVRGPVISPALAEKLKPYLRFRHFFRHAYSFQLSWDMMAPLVRDYPQSHALLAQELRAFIRELGDRE